MVAVEDGWNGFGTLQHTSSAAGALDVGFVERDITNRKQRVTMARRLGARMTLA